MNLRQVPAGICVSKGVCIPWPLKVHELDGGAVGGRLAVGEGRGAREGAAGGAAAAAREERRLLLAAH